jgi:hypothetical protein
MFIPSSYGTIGIFGYWMQLLDDDCSGYIQRGWLVALMMVVQAIFNEGGWLHHRRIGDVS